MGESVDGVDDELDLGVLFVAEVGETQAGRADGNVGGCGGGRGGGLGVVRQETSVHFLPVVAVPRVALVVGRRQRQHVVVESRDAL